MFECRIELLSTLQTEQSTPRYLNVATFSYNPGFQVGDDIYVYWEVWNKKYSLKSKVIQIKKEIHGVGNKNLKEKFGDEAENGCYLLRIFIEAEDRDAIVEISESLGPTFT